MYQFIMKNVILIAKVMIVRRFYLTTKILYWINVSIHVHLAMLLMVIIALQSYFVIQLVKLAVSQMIQPNV